MEISPSPAPPTENQNLDVVSHSALPLLQSGYPPSPPPRSKAAQFWEPSEGVSAELYTSSQAERNMLSGLC